MGKSAKSTNTSKKDSKKDGRHVKAEEEIRKKNGKERIKSRKGKTNHSYDTREEIELSNILSQLGMTILHVSGDGNCMFRSIADQLTGDDENYEVFRVKILDYIVEHKDYFALFMEDDENMDDYITRMRDNGEWGGHQELYAASQCFSANITIYQLDGPTYVISADTTGKGSNKKCMELRLSYHGDCHYNSVRVKDNVVAAAGDADKVSFKVKAYVFEADVDTVKAAVPWIEHDKIEHALELHKGSVDAAIEHLCAAVDELGLTDAKTVPEIEEKPHDADGSTVDAAVQDTHTQMPIAPCSSISSNSAKSAGSALGDDKVPGTSVAPPAVSGISTAPLPTGTTISVNNASASSNGQDKVTSYRKSGPKAGKPLSKKVRYEQCMSVAQDSDADPNCIVFSAFSWVLLWLFAGAAYTEERKREQQKHSSRRQPW